MRPADPLRFIHSLADGLLRQPWLPHAMQPMLPNAFRHAGLDAPLRVPKLAARIALHFKARPTRDELVEFLKSDKGLARAMKRALAAAVPPKRALVPQPEKMDQPPAAMANLFIPTLDNEAALAKWFGTDPQHLRWRADISGRNRRHRSGPLRTYRYRWIPRKQGLPRLLEIPKSALKAMQRKILAEILDAIPVHPAAHGFSAGRSIITNAAQHCGKPTVLRFDLTDFFPSISAARVFRIFRTLGYPASVARLLMGICTTSLPADVWDARPGGRIGADFLARQRWITRHLPQGAPTSPALANLAANRLDRRLTALANSVGAHYTRYADDITFSGDSDLARNRKRLATLVAVIADDEGFALNHRKTRLMRAGVRQHICGIVVNSHPNIPRAEFDRLKAILTNCVRQGPTEQNRDQVPDFHAHLAGKVSHVRAVHPARGEKLLRLFEQIDWP
jgi:retron-type reverse transcriptase